MVGLAWTSFSERSSTSIPAAVIVARVRSLVVFIVAVAADRIARGFRRIETAKPPSILRKSSRPNDGQLIMIIILPFPALFLRWCESRRLRYSYRIRAIAADRLSFPSRRFPFEPSPRFYAFRFIPFRSRFLRFYPQKRLVVSRFRRGLFLNKRRKTKKTKKTEKKRKEETI